MLQAAIAKRAGKPGLNELNQAAQQVTRAIGLITPETKVQ